MESVGFDGEDVLVGEFFLAEREHLVREVDSEDWGCVGSGTMFEESHCHIAGAAAEIESDGFGLLEDWAEDAGGAGPPGTVDADGEEMIRAVVGGGDGVEHLLHVCGGVLLGHDAGGTGSSGAFMLGRVWGGHRSMLDGG